MTYSISSTNIVTLGTSGPSLNVVKVTPLSSTQETNVKLGTLSSTADGTAGDGTYHSSNGASGGSYTACKDVFSTFSLAKTSSYSSGLYCLFTANGNASASISLQANNTHVAYNTTSDYRLKENISSLDSQIDNIKSLRPVTFTVSNSAKPTQEIMGFIAHELASVYPQYVSGEKDAVDNYGKPKYQDVDYRGITTPLIKSLQETMLLIETLEGLNAEADARIVALEKNSLR